MKRGLAGVVAALALAGCDAVAPAPPAPCGAGAVLGVDVAHHQGDIDWARAAGSGVRFAWIKATEGGDFLDEAFRRNWLGAEAAGVRRGAYHFVYWCRPASDQANWFVANVPADPGALPPVLDIEWTPDSRSCPGKLAREPALAMIRVMLAAMERAYGVRPIVYVPGDIYRDLLAGDGLPEGELDGFPLWVRGLNGRPNKAYGPHGWRAWQYAEDGHVPGIAGAVDLDCLAGPFKLP